MDERLAQMRIRPALFDDLPAIENCARAAYAIYVERIGKEPAPMVADFAALIARGVVHVATDGNDNLCGFVVFYRRGEGVHLENVAVMPNRQGAGIGRQLISFVEAWALRHGFLSVDLYTNTKMTDNLVLYPALGYVETGRREEDGFNRVYYRKGF